MHVIVLGCGLVGGPIAVDLSADFRVTVADISTDALVRIKKTANVETVQADLSDKDTVAKLVQPADFVVSAVPGRLGFSTLETLARCGKNGVDITFMPEDALLLNPVAQDNGCTLISDMGVAPGMSNVLAAFSAAMLDTCEKLEIFVGGLPRVRTWPWQYKAVFSPADVIEEYTRPARLVRHGKVIELPALSEPELIEVEGVGTLEAFNSDGLRSLIHTFPMPDMVEKTLRYPGHRELMQVLAHAGFFDTQPVDIGHQQVIPRQLTSRLLFSQWQLTPGEQDITVMKIVVTGTLNGIRTSVTWSLYDEYDQGIHSMARTTGYAATAALRMLASRKFTDSGIFVPEHITRHGALVEFLLTEQAARGVRYHKHISQL